MKKIVLNTVLTNFLDDLSYLLKKNYDYDFLADVYSRPLINIVDFQKKYRNRDADNSIKNISYRIEYDSMMNFTNIANTLQIMYDTKAIF